MLAWLRSWKGGVAVAAACLLAGLVRVVSAPPDWLTWALFPLAAGYALAAVVERRADNVRRASARSDRRDPTNWTTRPSRPAAWLRAEHGWARHPGQEDDHPRERTVALLTKDRVGATLAITAAVVGLVSVLQEPRESRADDHDGRATPGSSSQVVPAPGDEG